MNRLTVYTQGHYKELRELIRKCTIYREGQIGGLQYISFGYGTFDAQGFIKLMQRIIIRSNPAIKYSDKTEEYLLHCIFPDIDCRLENELTLFVDESSKLHLEGYAQFRMWEYGHHLNIMLYSLIKNLKY